MNEMITKRMKIGLCYILVREQDHNLMKKIKKDQFNIYQIGDIEIAEKHTNSNRPLKEIKPQRNPEHCPCCNFPVMKPNYFEPFEICDTRKFFKLWNRCYFIFFIN